MPRGGGRGGGSHGRGAKRTHKGGRRHFTDEEELKHQIEKKEREAAWHKTRGGEGDEDQEDRAAARGLPPSDDSDTETDSDEEDQHKQKGVEHLIEIENPNRMGGRQLKKVTEMDTNKGTQLTRREKQEIEKQQAKAHYQKLHMEGKTEEARSDLARLALIRKQREEAAIKREAERKAKEEAGKKS